jgi:hypothetical protein
MTCAESLNDSPDHPEAKLKDLNLFNKFKRIASHRLSRTTPISRKDALPSP